MEPKIWHIVVAEVELEAAEAVESAFNLLNATGTASFRPARSDAKTISISGYFEELPSEESVRAALSESLLIAGHVPDQIIGVSFDTIGEQDWLVEWKKGWKPTQCGKFLIAPPWDRGPFPTDVFVIRIEPGMAFGTGTHETTRLCLAAIGDTLRPGWSVLDVGTGTGILAIAAAKVLGNRGRGIVGIDNDPVAVKIARENAELNETSEITFREGTIDAEKHAFEVVVANLTLDVIRPILPALLSRAKNALILSGILYEQASEISAALKEIGIEKFTVCRDGEWIVVKVALASD